VSEQRFDCIEERLDKMQQQLDQILEMVAVGKATFIIAKFVGWGTAVAVAVIEIWRTLHK
jgi:hypothetical protein